MRIGMVVMPVVMIVIMAVVMAMAVTMMMVLIHIQPAGPGAEMLSLIHI